MSLFTLPIQSGLIVGVYEFLKYQRDNGQLAELTDVVPLPYFAAVVSSIAMHPIDTIRKLSMLSATGNSAQYATLKPSQFLLSVFKTQNWLKLTFAGFTLSVVRNALWISLIYGRHSDAYKQLEQSC